MSELTSEAPPDTAPIVSPLLGELDATAYAQHPLHTRSPDWAQTNCYVDVWIEFLGSLGLDPLPVMACAFSADFLGDQWEFLKVRESDLLDCYGIRVGEYDTWRPLLTHARLQTEAGNFLLFEADSYFLPDTRGITYRQSHQKSSIIPTRIDPHERRLDYFHNDGFFSLEGDDFDGIFGALAATGCCPRPYVELVRLDRGAPGAVSRDLAIRIAADHVRAAPATNPVARMLDRIELDLPDLAAGGDDFYHAYCFATTRQLGLTAYLAAEVSRRVLDEPAASAAADDFLAVSTGAKKLQFRLARAARGRSLDVAKHAETLAEPWARAMTTLSEGLGVGRSGAEPRRTAGHTP